MSPPRFTDLPKRQAETLEFLSAYVHAYGVSPSYVEIGAALGLKSKNSVSSLLDGLEWSGFIRRLPMRARAIEILMHPPTDARPNFGQIIEAALTHNTPTKILAASKNGIRIMSTNQRRALIGLPPLQSKEHMGVIPNA